MCLLACKKKKCELGNDLCTNNTTCNRITVLQARSINNTYQSLKRTFKGLP